MLIDYRKIRDEWPVVCLIVLAIAFTLLAHEVIVTNAITVDECAHLPAGVSYWDLGRFYIYRENPPFVQALAALPVWLSGAKMDYSRVSPNARCEWDVGVDFMRANSSHCLRYFARARSVIVIFAIACGVLIFRWSGELYGRASGLLSAALWFLDPNVMAFSSVVTTDVGAAAFGCLAAYAFWCFLRAPTWKNALLSGCALGLAQGSKFSLLVLFPVWIVQAFLARHAAPLQSFDTNLQRRPSWLQLTMTLGIALFTLNALYQFDGTFTPLRAFVFKSHALSGTRTLDIDAPGFGNRFRNGLFGDFRVPVPNDYIIGLDSQKWDEEFGFLRVNDGRLVRGGRWYGPFASLSQKLPLGTLLLLLAAAAVALFDLRRPTLALGAVWIPTLLMLGMFCSQVGLNWVIRYHLIVFPFLFIGVGRLVQVSRNHGWARLLIVACLLWNVGALVRIRPDYLSYGNELVGGPAGAQKVFLGSNFDWGQDLLRLKWWCDEHPDTRPIALSFYGTVDPESIGLRVRPLPTSFDRPAEESRAEFRSGSPKPFFWAISSNVLHGMPGLIMLEDGSMGLGLVQSPLLKPEKAVARIGQTIYVFRIGPSSRQLESGNTIPFDRLYGCVDLSVNVHLLVSP
ncbi:MAG: ArnT family glycosyltransferase [Isosphaerales bacterium]